MVLDERWRRISVEDIPMHTPLTDKVAGSLTNSTLSWALRKEEWE